MYCYMNGLHNNGSLYMHKYTIVQYFISVLLSYYSSLFHFSPLMSFQSILEVQVRQKSKFVDEHIGQIRVSINNLTVSKTLRKSWYKLAAKPGKTSTKIRGDILLATSFLSNWDTKESASSRSIIDFDLPESSGKMLSRSKSEYKSKSKNSPKSEKQHKTKSVFDRIRKNKSTAAFEECEDFLVSMRTPGSPPTPPAGSERVNSTTLTRSGSNGDHSSSVGNTSTDFQEMFSEATQLEKKGILDLSLVDPKTRVELGKQRFESTLIEDSEGRQDNEDLDVVSTYMVLVMGMAVVFSQVGLNIKTYIKLGRFAVKCMC